MCKRIKTGPSAYLRVAIPPIVSEHGGEIDSLIGDAIMATWGTRGDQPDHARRAVDAALAVQRETCRIADEHPGWPRFRAAVELISRLDFVRAPPRVIRVIEETFA